MLVLLSLLIASYLKLNVVGRTTVNNAEKWCVDIPFSVYLGWISVATIANITDWLYFVNWDGFGIAPPRWAVLMIMVAALLGLIMALSRKDSGYLLVLVWSFAGIAVKQSTEPNVKITAITFAVTTFVLVLFSIFERWRVKI